MIISAKLRMSWVVLFQFQCLDFYGQKVCYMYECMYVENCRVK